MNNFLLATYIRSDTYNGHSKINHYHTVTELRCYRCDNSKAREMGILINGELCPDRFDIIEYNYQGKEIYAHRFNNHENANKCLVALLKLCNIKEKSL